MCDDQRLAPLEGLLRELPSPRYGWSRTDRNKFVVVFMHVVDFIVPLKEKES